MRREETECVGEGVIRGRGGQGRGRGRGRAHGRGRPCPKVASGQGEVASPAGRAKRAQRP